MSEDKSIKLIKAVKELNIGMGTIVDFLATKGFKVEKQPKAKLDGDMYNALLKEFLEGCPRMSNIFVAIVYRFNLITQSCKLNERGT